MILSHHIDYHNLTEVDFNRLVKILNSKFVGQFSQYNYDKLIKWNNNPTDSIYCERVKSFIDGFCHRSDLG